MTVEQAHIDELKKQLADIKAENERFVYKLGQQKTAMVDHAAKAREDEKKQHAPIVDAARKCKLALAFALGKFQTDGATGVVVDDVSEALNAVRAALEAKFPTPGVYPPREMELIHGAGLRPKTKYILRKGDAGFVYFYREGDACWTQDKDAAKRFDTATAASMFAISHGLGGVDVQPTT